MKNLTNTIVIALSAILVSISPVQAEMATKDEAFAVAKNWITLIVHNEGNWGGSESAEVEGIQEFKRGERVIGYFCSVQPKGFIVVSLLKELAPVKAYSANSNLDPETNVGLTDFIKICMEDILDVIEKQAGQISLARTRDVQSIVKTNYRPESEILSGDVQSFRLGLESGAIAMDYQPGIWLLTSSWHRKDPYNRECPPKEVCDHAEVGCVATAAAQIMRYWAWPPFGFGQEDNGHYVHHYDWANMPDKAYSFWPDEDPRVKAVSQLCYDVGKEAGMDYGCDESTAWLGDKPEASDMSDAYMENFFYSTDVDFEMRFHHSDDGWFNIIKGELNSNRPLQYGRIKSAAASQAAGIAGHSMVCDGWKVEGDTRYVHMIWGDEDTGKNAWYNLNNIEGSEGLIRGIRPENSLGSHLEGDYPQSQPSYFDLDATGNIATFGSDTYRQFLPGVTVKCIGLRGQISFEGPSQRLFSIKGTATGGKVAGIQIYNGAIKLYENGGLTFH